MKRRPTLAVPAKFTKTAQADGQQWVESARAALELLAGVSGSERLAGRSILDYGCGSKLVKVLLEDGYPIERYVGVDVDPDLIGFLDQHVDDPRFSFHRLDVRNEMYNPTGEPLEQLQRLPVGDERFDVICAFSLFTHLAPHDWQPLLRLLRPQASPNCRLVATLYLNEQSATGHGLVDHWRPVFEEAGFVQGDEPVPDFVDFFPDEPLKWAVYSRPYALGLVEGTGWQVESILDPTPAYQHVLVCSPVQGGE